MLYYLAALRVGASGASGIMALCFAQRLAEIQRNKRDLPKANSATRAMNWMSIQAGQLGGLAVGGMWLYIGMTDWAGMHYPHWMCEIPEVYFLSACVHLLSPSPDHDDRPGTVMARSGIVALHALVFIPTIHTPAFHNCQLIIGQSLTAGWFRTFKGEWNGTKQLQLEKAEHQHNHDDHAAAEGAEVGEQGSDMLHHFANALA